MILHENLGKSLHGAQRRAQIVRNGIDEESKVFVNLAKADIQETEETGMVKAGSGEDEAGNFTD